MTSNADLQSDRKAMCGEKVDYHCPYDEAQLRIAKQMAGRFICPCCFSTFSAQETRERPYNA